MLTRSNRDAGTVSTVTVVELPITNTSPIPRVNIRIGSPVVGWPLTVDRRLRLKLTIIQPNGTQVLAYLILLGIARIP